MRGVPAQSLQLKTDWPQPTAENLKKGDVLVKVTAAALNPLGYQMMKLLPNFVAKRPSVPECDFSGVIVEGNGSAFSVGEKVFGSVRPEDAIKFKQGSLAEYAFLPASTVCKQPENVTDIEAAGLFSVGLTALGLIETVALAPGETVFINGGSSSVGAAAIQIAKAKGLRVVATASGRNEELVRSFGADEFIDYTKEPLAGYLVKNPPAVKYSAIIDAVGMNDQTLFFKSEAYLAPKGPYLTTSAIPNTMAEFGTVISNMSQIFLRPGFLGGTKRKFTYFVVNPTPAHIEEFTNYVRQGKVKPFVDSVHNFEDVLKAYEVQMSGRARGKIVVKVDPSAA